MLYKRILTLLTLAQLFFALRVLLRLARTAGGAPIRPEEGEAAGNEQVAVIVPVLNERQRLAPCLDGLLTQGKEVVEIIVVDGGSNDGTQDLITSYKAHDARIRLLDASPVSASWNGKAWGLQKGLEALNSQADYIVTVDADVRPAPGLVKALLGRALRDNLAALSIATRQEIEGIGEGLLHPALLTTLVYRFGMPGKPIRRVSEVQANGQCFLFRRDALLELGGFVSTRSSICEDVTIGRALVQAGYRLGFYEAGDLIRVKMYTNWRETWLNWPRSLPMRDQYSGVHALLGWCEIALVQALPLPWLFFLLVLVRNVPGPKLLNCVLVLLRSGILIGTARAYVRRPWSYWFSPLCDVPVAAWLARMALRRRHTWRGRMITRGA